MPMAYSGRWRWGHDVILPFLGPDFLGFFSGCSSVVCCYFLLATEIYTFCFGAAGAWHRVLISGSA